MDPLNLSTNHISYSAKDKSKTSQDSAAQKKSHIGTAVAATTVGVGLTALALGKGLNKTNRGKLNKFYNYITKKSRELAKKPVITKSEQITQDIVNTSKSVAESTRAIMNTISLKDILFKKITEPIPVIGKACQKITDFFENIAVKTTISSYKSTTTTFEKMFNEFDKANQKVSSKVSKKAENTLQNIRKNFYTNFGIGEVSSRIQKSKKVFKNLDENFWEKSFKNVKGFTTDSNTYSSFIAEKMIAGDKSKLIADINNKKASIQFCIKDDYNNMKNIMEDIKGLINPFKKAPSSILDKISSNLEVFQKQKSPLAKEAILEDLKELSKFIEDKKIAEQFRKSIDSIPKSQNGKLQSLLNIYKEELSSKDFKKLEKLVNKSIKSLDKSTDLETDKLFDKMRDLKLGSAPTDMLTLMATAGTVGIGLSKAKDSDERTSAALKFGIPAIGTVLTTMYGTLKMFSAGQSLIFGAISGLIINKIGEGLDNLRLKVKGENISNKELVQMPTKQDITNAVVDNTIILKDAKALANGTEIVANTIAEAKDNLQIQLPKFQNKN